MMISRRELEIGKERLAKVEPGQFLTSRGSDGEWYLVALGATEKTRAEGKTQAPPTAIIYTQEEMALLVWLRNNADRLIRATEFFLDIEDKVDQLIVK